jgi:hypothetical protein
LANYRNTVLRAAQEVEDSIAAYLRAQEQVSFLAECRCRKAFHGSVLIQYRDLEPLTSLGFFDSERFLVQQQDNLTATQGNVVAQSREPLQGAWRRLANSAMESPLCRQTSRKRCSPGRTGMGFFRKNPVGLQRKASAGGGRYGKRGPDEIKKLQLF